MSDVHFLRSGKACVTDRIAFKTACNVMLDANLETRTAISKRLPAGMPASVGAPG